MLSLQMYFLSDGLEGCDRVARVVTYILARSHAEQVGESMDFEFHW